MEKDTKNPDSGHFAEDVEADESNFFQRRQSNISSTNQKEKKESSHLLHGRESQLQATTTNDTTDEIKQQHSVSSGVPAEENKETTHSFESTSVFF